MKKITSDFARLDVKEGRDELAKHLRENGYEERRVPVMIIGYIDTIWSEDDGTSREFGVVVERIDFNER